MSTLAGTLTSPYVTLTITVGNQRSCFPVYILTSGCVEITFTVEFKREKRGIYGLQ